MTEHNEAAVTTKDDTPRLKQTPGEMLRTARENAGMTLQAVSEALHLTAHYVRCLENDDYAKLPGLTFAKGYLRAYARYLRMDVDAVLANYENYLVSKGLRQHVHDFSTTSLSNIGGRGRSDQSFAWALMAGMVLVIALAAAWWFVGRDMEVGLAGTAAPTAQTSVTTPAATQTPGSVAPSPAQTFATPAAPQGFQQNFTQNSTSAPVANGVAENSATQAANAGVAVINATLEARQEEAQLANNAQANGVTDPAAQPGAANPGTTPGTAPTDPALAAGTQPFTSTVAPGTTASGTTAPLNSYSAPAAPDAATATLPAPSVGGIALQQPPAPNPVDTTATAPTTVIDNSGQEVITDAGGARVITLRGAGNDRLEIQLNGNSWAEIRDAQGADVFSDMLRGGDKLSVEGTAPFTVLLGDARQAQASFNAQAVDLSTLIRSDNTARFRLGAEGVSAIVRGTEQAAATATE